MISFAKNQLYYSPERFSESFGTLTNSQTTFRLCTPKFQKILRKPATPHRISMGNNQKVNQDFLGAETDFSQNSKRFGKMKLFYTLEKFNFCWKWFLVFLWDNFDRNLNIFQKLMDWEKNCLTERPKLIFMRNQFFLVCKNSTLPQNFWN